MKNEYLKTIGLLASLVVIFSVVQTFSRPVWHVNQGRVLSAATSTGFSLTASATDTLASLSSQVQSLINQNVDLQNQVGQLSLKTSVVRTLKKGMSGDDVLAFQKLFQQAQVNLTIPLSGYFGKSTEKAVKDFQKQENLPESGVVDQATLNDLTVIVSGQNPADESQYDALTQELNDVITNYPPATATDCSTPDASQSSSANADAITYPNLNYLTPGECPAGCVPASVAYDCPSAADGSAPDALPPADTTCVSSAAITNLNVSASTPTAENIAWSTIAASNSQVDYGNNTNYNQSSGLNSSMVTAHLITITGLSANTTYHFRIKSQDASGNLITSGDQTFTTTALPQISSIKTSSITASAATISWTTDKTSSSQVSYGKTNTYGQLSSLNSTLVTAHTVTLTGLAGNTQYHFQVISKDANGNSAASGDQNFTTTK